MYMLRCYSDLAKSESTTGISQQLTDVKKHTSLLLQSLFSALAAVWSVNSHGSNDTLP